MSDQLWVSTRKGLFRLQATDGGDHWAMLPNHLPPIYAVRFG